MKLLVSALLLSGMAAAPVLANDTMSQLGTGGLTFITSEDVSMDTEDLSISAEQVKVVYHFTNHGETDQHALVSFPLPDITGDYDFMISVPTENPANLFGFTTTFDGKPVESTLHQYAFSAGIDRTELLKSLNVPLLPFGETTIDALGGLTTDQKQNLVHLGLVSATGDGEEGDENTEYVPIWTLKSTYSWEANFKAGRTSEVVHEYQPSVGGTVAVTFLAPPEAGQEDYAAAYKAKYCTDDELISTLKKTLTKPDDYYTAPFTESWISYIWSTGANWGGPIGKFHLTIDKGDPKNLLSFCWNGPVQKTGPTTFEVTADDWWPPQDELEILILSHRDPQPEEPVSQ